jgi:hypothetical protein
VHSDDFTFLRLFSKRRFSNYTVVIPVLDTNTLNGAKANVWAGRRTFVLLMVLFSKGGFGAFTIVGSLILNIILFPQIL